MTASESLVNHYSSYIPIYPKPADPLSPVDASICTLRRVADRVRCTRLSNHANAKRAYEQVPRTLQARLDASLAEKSFSDGALKRGEISNPDEKGKTVLYLAYGSNLCNETFRGVRGIRPLSQINVQVPELRLTFDLPGVPYHEPCFANSALRDPGHSRELLVDKEDYHKDRWHKGLVGCVYEVTLSDFAHIIATEGGGASYHDILVTCYPLLDAETVPESPRTMPFKAHTLFASAVDSKSPSFSVRDRLIRPDPSYAQPSARYLKLITDGAAELSLPAEYQAYLNDIRPYTITSKRQRWGNYIFINTWWRFIHLLFELAMKLQDRDGNVPKWIGVVVGYIFIAMWSSYDGIYKHILGDGERTEGLDGNHKQFPQEKEGLLTKDNPGEERYMDV